MNGDQINSLIWGNFESEILEMEIPLWASRGIMKTMAMDGAFALFNGFLTFLMYKLGYKPILNEKFEVDLDDNSWWRNNLDDPSFLSTIFNSFIHGEYFFFNFCCWRLSFLGRYDANCVWC